MLRRIIVVTLMLGRIRVASVAEELALPEIEP